MKSLLEAIRPTVFIESRPLSEKFDAEITVATETFQHTGSFKFRAAYNLALNVPNDEILTASSGNFGQAIAYACKLLGKKCTVVMPETSAQVKIEGVKFFGATVDLIDTKKVGRNQRVEELAKKMPDAFIASAYDDLLVIEGNSTLGDEIANYEQDFDFVITPVGGGGLISGISKGLKRSNNSQAKLIGAEPLLGNDAYRSLQAGEIIRNEFEPMSIADGARTISMGSHNWEIIREGVSEIVEVSEENIKEAVRLYFSLANLKVEPTGALSLGAILEKGEKFIDKRVCLIVSGGNVDTDRYKEILN
ncbi:MAG TPA: pyridoxal-phosphate dependent enzyme [Pyrinomonadaceae bacterium]|nr:pyridoxal-phosphate dependent enzyme [Pyrinomonadaceae bacterium]